MINKKFGLIIFLGILLISIISAVGEVSYCCEKTESGAWCQNAPQNECNSDFRKVPTSCESTSYCKLGCCYNSKEGTCMENTPQKVCEDSKGVWSDDAECDIPQCSLGCCLIGEQAAFVTQTRCKALSSLYGLITNYRTDIGSEIECIASAVSDVKGACVFEKEYQKTCLFLTKKECQEMGSQDSGGEFHEGYLCSADELGTNCGPKGGTICVKGEDEVYFLDTCGNLANIYDYSKINNVAYWTYVAGYKSEVKVDCGDGKGTKDCGNCDYYSGSTCKAYKRGEGMTDPDYGDYVCASLDCEDAFIEIKSNGEEVTENKQHGETWCVKTQGISKIKINDDGEITSTGEDLPGGRYFRLVCYNGEINVEPCADFRQEVCVESIFNEGTINEFSTASCIVNKWQDCYSHDNQQDCENIDRRDCQWIKGNHSIFNILEDEEESKYDDGTKGACVPLYAPGFDFWNSEGDAESISSMANTECVVLYNKRLYEKEKKVIEDEKCYDECKDKGEDSDDCERDCKAQCITKNSYGNWVISIPWKKDRNYLCTSLGDCGNSLNAFRIAGYVQESVIRKDVGEEDEEEEEEE